MIKEYNNGKEFLDENIDFLKNASYQSKYFINNSELLLDCNNNNFAIKCEEDNSKILILKVEPYNAIIYGNKECSEDLFSYIINNSYSFDRYLAEIELGENIQKLLKEKYGLKYNNSLKMDFMEAEIITEKSYSSIEYAKDEDIDEIYSCMQNFIIDVGLHDKINKDKIANNISKYRLIRIDDKIASFAKFRESSDTTMNISDVYTRPEYRGLGLAKKVVNSIKNEIIKNGKIATLNVDQKNPISNHIYSSLGFRKVFSQSEFRKEE